MKTKIFLIPMLWGLLSATEALAQNSGSGAGGESPSPRSTSGAAINRPRSVEPSSQHLNFGNTNMNIAQPDSVHPNLDRRFNRSVITNRMGLGAITNNGGVVVTNSLDSGMLTNRIRNGGLTNNDHGFSLVRTNNGNLVNPTNPYASYTNRFSTNGNPYATDPRVMERNGSITNQ